MKFKVDRHSRQHIANKKEESRYIFCMSTLVQIWTNSEDSACLNKSQISWISERPRACLLTATCASCVPYKGKERCQYHAVASLPYACHTVHRKKESTVNTISHICVYVMMHACSACNEVSSIINDFNFARNYFPIRIFSRKFSFNQIIFISFLSFLYFSLFVFKLFNLSLTIVKQPITTLSNGYHNN